MDLPLHITAEGDGALALRFGGALDPEAQARAAAAARILAGTTLPARSEIVPSYLAVTVVYDPLLATFDQMREVITGALSSTTESPRLVPQTVVVPVCYGNDPDAHDFGPDLPKLAQQCGLAIDEAVLLHSRRTYRIDMLGFMPGFPYLSGLDERLRCPRLAVPRRAIPAGSVGIGNDQTGVYPLPSPGGWNLIGRTPARLFAPERCTPVPYGVGDLIRFEPIDRAAFEELASLEARGESCLHRENGHREESL